MLLVWSQSAISWQKWLQIKYFLFMLVHGSIQLTTFFSFHWILSEKTCHNPMQIIAILLAEQFEIVIYFMSLYFSLLFIQLIN
jgi:hypothetical protein